MPSFLVRACLNLDLAMLHHDLFHDLAERRGLAILARGREIDDRFCKAVRHEVRQGNRRLYALDCWPPCRRCLARLGRRSWSERREGFRIGVQRCLVSSAVAPGLRRRVLDQRREGVRRTFEVLPLIDPPNCKNVHSVS